MKKHYTLMLLASLLLIGTAKAQNRCVVESSKDGECVLTFSENKRVASQRENHVCIIDKPVQPHNDFRGLHATHHLTVNLPENLGEMYIGDETGAFADMAYGGQTTYEADLEEGLYYLFAQGYFEGEEEIYHCNWTRDFVISGDTEITVDFTDCNYSVNIYGVDEFGAPIEENEYGKIHYLLELRYHNLVSSLESVTENGFTNEIPSVRYNGFSEDCQLTACAILPVVGEVKYYSLYWIVNGMDDNVSLNCAQSDLNSHVETFTVNTPEGFDAIFHLDFKLVTPSGWNGLADWNINNIYLNEEPFTVVSNAKVYDPTYPRFLLLMPSVYEWRDYSNLDYYNNLRTAFYFDADGNAVKEAKPLFFEGDEANGNLLVNSPLKTILGPDNVGINGIRTPLAYFTPMSLTAEQNFGIAMVYGAPFFGGETGCERNGDSDAIIRVNTADGTELYNDKLYLYRQEGYFEFTEPTQMTIQVDNTHLTYNGVEKSNDLEVFIDYSKNDVMPPTTTFLRVNDAYGHEAIELPQIERSNLVFGCADFEWHMDEEWFYPDYILYNGKPEVELSYSIGEGHETFPLAFVEDESLFNDNYGNVFVVDLAQLAGTVNNAWVNLSFTVTDAAGNFQTQNLQNVFYVGEMTSVAETNTLAHTVYPNPFTNEVRINAAEAVNGNASISVFNVLGEQVISNAVNCSETTEFVIDGSSLNAGIYFYSISTENGTLQGRIVKE